MTATTEILPERHDPAERRVDPPIEAPLDARAEAHKRLQAKRDWITNLVSYVTVNAFLVGVWAMTGAGYFWPIWVIGGWGIGLVMHFWDAFLRRPVTEADVDAEMRRGRR